MAFNTNTPRASYIATAGQTVFPFTFKIFTDTNITVYKNQVALVLSTNYTVTINGDSGGSVTLLAGASLNNEIVIVRSLAITRDFDYQDNGDFFADTVDSDQDYQTYLVQDVDAKFVRTFKLPDAISGTVNSELPLPLNDAYIRWNSDSTAIINDTTIPNAVIEATTQAGIATTTALEASTSASQALISRNEAEGFRDEAEVFAVSIDPSNLAHLAGSETFTGLKTFSSSPIVPTPTADFQAATKEYVDDNISPEYNPTPIIATGTATFTATTNNINLTGIGIGVEIGDVIQISGTSDAKNNSEFTVEVITDANNIIVNQAHANKGTSKNVANRASDTGVTVKLLAKWYNAPVGLGQGWVNVTSSRVANTTYLSPTNRSIGISILVHTTSAVGIRNTATLGIIVYIDVGATDYGALSNTIAPNTSYSQWTGTVQEWKELR